VQTIEHRQGLKVACLPEIGWHHGWITDAQLKKQGDQLRKTQYGKYLLRLLSEKSRIK
jgi:glucose-1-phosphate thymidylyltransferase